MKPKMRYNIIPNLPAELEALRRLAYNIYFGWRDEIQDVFQRIDPGLWETSGHNPVRMLGLVSQERLNELAREQGFVSQLNWVVQNFERYLSQPRIQTEDYSPTMPFQIAYFSAEFGLTECLSMYSGGLGVLAGDHMKSASDLNFPIVGVGLLYQEGYFSQYLTSDGWQMETYPVNDFPNMPVTLVKDAAGGPLTITVRLKGVPVTVRIWRIEVGRVPLYLLDTNCDPNPPEMRSVTAQLYGGDREMRLRQEIVLGIGGVRALKALGIEPTVIHMNEGHSAFSALERINVLRNEKGLSFDAAREIVLASSVFTTHTPVPAGNDVFAPDLLRAYFEDYSKDVGINFRVLLGAGRLDPWNEAEPFGMTTLALRLSAHSNGVSRLHGQVSRSMWQKVWRHHPEEDVPIEHVTNGIHVPTWIAREIGELFRRYLGPEWAEDPDNEHVWEQIEQIPDTELWRAHERCREQLVSFTRRRLLEQYRRRGASAAEILESGEVFSADILTIGFARRFATYKRATLLFRDPDRLERILNDPQHPVQIVMAGKAHPQDNEGKQFIKDVIHLAREKRFRHRIAFIEDYNIHIAQRLVAGSDIWLNTPRRPLEACGTSGMKALANGALHVSVLDGWWDEGFRPEVGWSIGHGEVYEDYEIQDAIESEDLYNRLEEEIVPLFYQRGRDGLPRGWVAKMKAGLRHLVPVFNAHRMVQDYAHRYYLPCSRRFNELSTDDFAGAKDLAAWRQKLMTSWGEVAVLSVSEPDSPEKRVGEQVRVVARIKLGNLSPDDVTVEAYFGPLNPQWDFAARDTAAMRLKGVEEGVHVYEGDVPCRNSGHFGYTIRVTPSQARLENRFIMGLVTWA